MSVEGQPPEDLRLGPPERRVRFRLRSDLIALHGPRPAGATARAVLSLPGAGIEIVAANDVAADEARLRGPVYAQEPTGSLAAPTGRVFLRLAKGGRPGDLVTRLAQQGFELVEDHVHAPGTAWAAPSGGRIGAGLARLGRLASIPGVEGAEPELLRESRRR